MDELKACPFCGSHNVKMFYDERQNYHVECYGCNKTVSFHIVEKSSQAKAVETWNRRAQPESKPLELHFGDGKIGVSACRPEDSEKWNELLLWNPQMQQNIGNSIPIKDGTTTDDVEVYARLFFHNTESAQVVVDALNRIIDSYGENKPLTLEQLRQMDGAWVWLVDTERPEYNGWYNVRPFHGGNHDIELYGVDNNYYVRAITNGRIKVYAHKPEQEEQNV